MFDPAAYGNSCAAYYDQLYPAIESGLVDTLRALAGDGLALELGIATGRVAMRLHRAGVRIHGIEASSAMINALHARTDGVGIPVIHGDFASTPLGAQYRLIYSLVSTFSLLPALELQRACLCNIAAHLAEGGSFVSEGFEGESSFPLTDCHEHALETSLGVKNYRVTCLNTPLAIIDSMAESCGLMLVERWSDWKRTPYKVAPRHISRYQLIRDGVRHLNSAR